MPQIAELQSLLADYERKLGISRPATAFGGGSSGGSAEWELEECVLDGAAYLWDKGSRRLYTYAAAGQYPRPVGFKELDGTGAWLAR